MRFDSAAVEYIARLKRSGGKTIARKERVLALHITPFFGSTTLSKVGPSMIGAYVQKRREQGAKGGTINRELAVISHLMGKAVEWGWLRQRPKIERVAEGTGRIDYLTSAECQALIEASKLDVSPHAHCFFVVALSTGMRMSEVLSIAVSNIDCVKRRILVPKAKAGSRDQPITGNLASFLDGYIKSLPDNSAWLFPSPRAKSGHLVTIRKAHRRTVARAGLDLNRVLRHTLRHTAVTHLVQAGVDLPTVQKISGHKTLSMVARYSHANGAHIDQAMKSLETRIPLGLVDHGAEGGATPKLHQPLEPA